VFSQEVDSGVIYDSNTRYRPSRSSERNSLLALPYQQRCSGQVVYPLSSRSHVLSTVFKFVLVNTTFCREIFVERTVNPFSTRTTRIAISAPLASRTPYPPREYLRSRHQFETFSRYPFTGGWGFPQAMHGSLSNLWIRE